MAETGKEPTGSMGADARACPRCADRAPSLFSYFKQRFAQVTNPAIDSLREDLVMSLTTWLGRGPGAARGRAAAGAGGCGSTAPVLDERRTWRA